MAQIYKTIKNSSTKRLVLVEEVADLPPTAVTSALYFVRNGRRLYIWNGTYWLPIITENEPPSWVNVPSNPTTILLNDVYTLTLIYDDPEKVKGTFGFSVTSGSIGAQNSVTLDSNTDEFTIEANAASVFELTFTANDGANEIEQTVEFILRLEEYFEQSVAKLPNESFANSNLGISSSVTDEYWAIGAPGYASPGASAGIVLIFKKQPNQFTGEEEWVYDTTLQPSDISSGQNFGKSLSLYEKYLVVGANNHTAGRGKVYLFENQSGTWTELSGVLGGAGDNLGNSVDINGRIVAAGAPGYSSNTGYVALYNIFSGTLNNYTNLQGFTGAGAGSKIGWSVSLDGEYTNQLDYYNWSNNLDIDGGIAGGNVESRYLKQKTAMHGDWAAFSRPWDSNGFVQIFRKDTDGNWSAHSILQSPENIAGGEFGHGIAIDNNRIVIGEPGNTTNRYNTVNYGKVYVFIYNEETDTWDLEQTLDPTRPSHRTGSDVDISGNTIIIGFAGPNDFNLNDTWALPYELIDGVWTQGSVLTGDYGTANGEFVAVDGDIIAISTNRESTGKVYVYERQQDGVSWGRVLNFTGPATNANGTADQLGRDVSISGNRIVIGRNGSYSESYSYQPAIGMLERSSGGTYSFREIPIGASVIPASYGVESSTRKLGQCVDIDGDYICVGMPALGTGNGDRPGGFAVFKIVRDDVFLVNYYQQTADFQHQGWHVSMDNGSIISVEAPGNAADTANQVIFNVETNSVITHNKFILAAGAPSDNSNQGAVWVFENTQPESWNGVETISKLVGQYDSSGDEFGSSVAALNHYVACGVPNSDIGNLNGGMAYVYKKNDAGVWIENSVCLPGDAPSNALFGNSLSFSQTLYPGQVFHQTLAIGAKNADGIGAVYLFKNDADPDSFIEHRKVTDADSASNDQFGESVDISNRYFVSGSPGDESLSGTVNNVGKSKLYRLG